MSEIQKLGDVFKIGDTLIIDGEEYLYEKVIRKYMPTLGYMPNMKLRSKTTGKIQLFSPRMVDAKVRQTPNGWELIKQED